MVFSGFGSMKHSFSALSLPPSTPNHFAGCSAVMACMAHAFTAVRAGTLSTTMENSRSLPEFPCESSQHPWLIKWPVDGHPRGWRASPPFILLYVASGIS